MATKAPLFGTELVQCIVAHASGAGARDEVIRYGVRLRASDLRVVRNPQYFAETDLPDDRTHCRGFTTCRRPLNRRNSPTPSG